MQPRRAFSLVELLVVIAIVAVLVAILLPAVQMTREAARKTQCANNQRQVAIATLQHVGIHDRFPSVKHPRYSEDQTSISWRVTILPYLEQQQLFDVFNDPTAWRGEWVEEGSVERLAIVPEYACPSTPATSESQRFKIAGPSEGEVLFDHVSPRDNIAPFLVSYPQQEWGLGAWWGTKRFDPGPSSQEESKSRQRRAMLTGAKVQYVTDGLSHTIMVAEQASTRFVWLPWYGGAPGVFIITLSPYEVNSSKGQVFSYHASGAHVSLCDGSVRFLSEDTSRDVVGALLTRSDGTPQS